MIPSSLFAQASLLRRRNVITLLAAVVSLTLMLAGSAGAGSSTVSARFSAHLSATTLTGSQTGSVVLVYRFAKPAKHFSYRLSFKSGEKWQTVKSVTSRKQKGDFRGSKATSLKKLFAGKPARVGSYRLKLSAGTGGKRLDFKVVTARPYISRISAAGSHTCVIGAGGRVKCWGANDQGQLGDGTKVDKPTAVAARGISGATEVRTSGNYTCALLSHGAVRCWGSNDHGQLGNGTARDSSTPVATVGISRAVGVSTGTGYACALFSSGRVKCWGTGEYGGAFGSIPTQIPGISTAVQISEYGATGACALLASGTIRCWHSYLLGASFDLEGFSHVAQITSFCALLTDGTVSCPDWNTGRPARISGITHAVQVSDSCAVISDGTIKCRGTRADGREFVFSIPGITSAVQMSSGWGHDCALLSGGAVKCWGSSLNGQLGVDWRPFRTTPVAVKGIESGAQVRGGSAFTCAVLDSGGVDCWGGNHHGELGNGTSGDANSSLIPLPVSGISSATRVGTGFGHACALLSNGSIRCWGYNYDGQLGNGSSLSDAIASPVQVPGVSNATDVSAGAFHSCALLSDGTIKCWGAGYDGQLGDGALTGSSTPVAVSGISDAIQLSAGAYDTCAVRSNGTVWCWGSNEAGQLGDGKINGSGTPVEVSGISNAIRVSVGGREPLYGGGRSHACALLADHTVKCWGGNNAGQLGNGTTTDSPIPVMVSGIASAVDISAGGYNTCAVLSVGAIKCWGGNSGGELGNGTTTNSSTPITVSGISNAIQVSASDQEFINEMSHTCAVLSNHALRCWGDNHDGELGNGEGDYSPTPVSVIGIP